MIKQLELEHIPALATLGLLLWPTHAMADLTTEFSELIAQPETAFFGKLVDGRLVGFAQCQLRQDYVEGTRTSPVGYLEGIYVMEAHRRQGVAKDLCQSCESWCRQQGCLEFASDCEVDNEESLLMHLHLGFIEVNRLICFNKQLF